MRLPIQAPPRYEQRVFLWTKADRKLFAVMGIHRPYFRCRLPVKSAKVEPKPSTLQTTPAFQLPPKRPSAALEGCDDDDNKSSGSIKDGSMLITDISPNKMRKIAYGQNHSDTGDRHTTAALSPSQCMESTASTDPTEHVDRSYTPGELVNLRDGNRCILTGDCNPDAVEILPLSLSPSGEKIYPFALYYFLSEETLSPQWNNLFQQKVFDEPQKNLLSLSQHMHSLWDEHFFALKPVSATEQEVTVQFHWLKGNTGQYKDEDLFDFDTAMQAVCNGDTQSWGTPQTAHLPNGDPILTGQLFTIRADTPDQLPNTDLLQVQWFWRRLYAMTSDRDFYYGCDFGRYSDDDESSDFESDDGNK